MQTIARRWIAQTNQKCPKTVQDWFHKADTLNLFNHEREARYSLRPEDWGTSDTHGGNKPLPSPPVGFRLDHLWGIPVGTGVWCRADYLDQTDAENRRTRLFHLIDNAWQVALENEGTLDVDGMEFLRLNAAAPVMAVVVDFGGGSGIGRKLYALPNDRAPQHLLDIGNWNEGGYNLVDLDGDGTPELIHRTRTCHPKTLERRLRRKPSYDDVSPILYRDSIYRWKGTRFVLMGTRYWIDG